MKRIVSKSGGPPLRDMLWVYVEAGLEIAFKEHEI
jgi:hypothetical protein